MRLKLVAWTLAALMLSTPASAAPPGPKLPDAAAPDAAHAAPQERSAYDGPPLTIAVPVFDPGLPSNPATWDEKGIWPSLRRAETVYAAHKVGAALRDLQRFEKVFVSPDDSVSADLYLTGRIKESDGEDFAVVFDLMDATGSVWLRSQKVKHRRPEREMHMPVTAQQDPFGGVWIEVARRVDEALGKQAQRHSRENKRNLARAAKGKSTKMTVLERVTAVRDLMFARFFAPETYASAVKVGSKTIKLGSLPPMSGESWRLMLAVQARDDEFNARLTRHYADFADKMGVDYALWQADAFPVAHERRKRREAAIGQGIGAVLLLAAASAVEDDLGTLGKVAAAGAVSAMALSSFQSNQARREEAQRLNELGASVNAAMQPMNVEMGGKRETLTGAAHEQFAQWRGLLKGLHDAAAGNPDAVRIVSGKA